MLLTHGRCIKIVPYLGLLRQFLLRQRKCKLTLQLLDPFLMELQFRRKIQFAILLLASALAVTNGIQVSCSYSTMGMSYVSGSPYTCQATLTEDGSDDITLLSGAHTGSMTNANVQGFYVMGAYQTKFNKLPSNLATYFPNLVYISVDNTRMKTLTSADLKPFSNLVYFSAQMNLLRVLPGDTFDFNLYLAYLNLAYNSIQYVGAGFLSKNTLLTNIQFQYNRCLGQSMYMYIGNGYTVADYVSDVNFLCGPGGSSSGGYGTIDSCPANCTASANILEAEIDEIQAVFTEPCWIRLKNMIKAWFCL